MARQGEIEAEAILASIPDLPAATAYLWEWWRDLNSTRSCNGMGLSPLSRLEIARWVEDEAIPLERWERRALLDIDKAYLRLITGGEFEETEAREAHE